MSEQNSAAAVPTVPSQWCTAPTLPRASIGNMPDRPETQPNRVTPPYPRRYPVPGFSERTSASLPKLLGRLRFRHLSLLVALDDYRNLHRAASSVHLAQPSATKLIQDLEALFGSSLFDRSAKGMCPTEFGAMVVAFARQALGELKCLAHEVDHTRATRHRHLAIGTALDLVPDLVLEAMTELKRHRPALAIKVYADHPNEMSDRVIRGHTDLAVGYFSDDCEHLGLEFHSLRKDPLLVVARQSHPLCRKVGVTLCELARMAWIFNPFTSAKIDLIDQIFARPGIEHPTDVVESHSVALTLNLVLRSDAITILPESIARTYVRSQQLGRLSVTITDTVASFGFLTRQDEVLIPAAVEFTRLLIRGSESCALPGARQINRQLNSVT